MDTFGVEVTETTGQREVSQGKSEGKIKLQNASYSNWTWNKKSSQPWKSQAK